MHGRVNPTQGLCSNSVLALKATNANLIEPVLVLMVSIDSGRISSAILGETPGREAPRPAPAAEMIVRAEF